MLTSKFIPAERLKLSVVRKLFAVISCFSVILMVAWIPQQFWLIASYPMLTASMGASTVIVFFTPNSPMAQPWPLVGGQLVSLVIGLACGHFVSDMAFASAYAVAGSVFAMLILRCLHPPGAASALAPIISGKVIETSSYTDVLIAMSLNVTIMLLSAVVINRWLLGYEYPTKAK
jgi:CBS domain-containing membrane protein